MINLLLFVHILELRGPDQGGPQHVPGDGPIPASHKIKSSSFHRVNHAVICVSLVTDSEGQA